LNIQYSYQYKFKFSNMQCKSLILIYEDQQQYNLVTLRVLLTFTFKLLKEYSDGYRDTATAKDNPLPHR